MPFPTNCPIREHTADGAFVGRCDFGLREGICPRHGKLSDYPTLDDREVEVKDRDFAVRTTTPWYRKCFLRSA